MNEIYKFAAKNSLRFPSTRGELTVEQLFQLPLKTVSQFDLDTVARTIYSQLKEVSEESFVEDIAADPRKQMLTVSLDIVKDVIATKQADNRAMFAHTQRAVERKKILDAISAKKDEKLTQSSLDELEKQLAALDV
jgi:hypothetical protein